MIDRPDRFAKAAVADNNTPALCLHLIVQL
jgi:hypothetical protein